MLPLARYTVLESLRDKIYLGFLVVMALMTIFFLIVGSTPWGLTNYIVERLGWMTIDVMLSFQTAIYAVNNIYRERDKKILYTHLTLPIGRSRYLAGKGLGLLLVILFLATIGVLILLVGDRYFSSAYLSSFRWELFWIVPSVVLKNAVLLAYVLLFSQIASNALTASLFTIGVYVMGNGADELLNISARLDGAAHYILKVSYFMVPNLQLLDFEHAALYQGRVPLEVLLNACIYAGSYITFAFVFACLIFKRKDL